MLMKTGSVLDESKYILINIIAITGVERITANGNAINSLKKLFFPPKIPKMEPRKNEIKKEKKQRIKVVKKLFQNCFANNSSLHFIKTEAGDGKISSELMIVERASHVSKRARNDKKYGEIFSGDLFIFVIKIIFW